MSTAVEPPRTKLWARAWVRLLLYLFIGYVGFVSMLLFFENRLVYHPTNVSEHWLQAPVADIQDVELTCADGTSIHAWWCPADSDQALLYCHGNAGNLSHRGGSIVTLRKQLNASVLIIDYPGYGKSAGIPSETGCYQAADAGYAWLTQTKQFEPKKVLLYGASLGGGVIIDLASREDHRALILVKTFTSLPDTASDLYWWLPAPKRMLMRNQFDSLSKIGKLKRPVFIAHGTSDTLIRHSHGERLFEAVTAPKRFFSMPGARHNDGLPEEFYISLRDFLKANTVE
jgi:uncharacterized protein